MIDSPPSAAYRTPSILVIVAWLFVGVPAAWGVSQTFRQALKLFQHAPVAATTNPAAPGAGVQGR